jgi:hypothetical protein
LLDWLTFAAAALAAVGAVVGPLVALRSVQRTERQADLDRQQQQVDLAIQYAVSESPAIAEMGLKQLSYLLERGRLTAEQQMQAATAIEAALARAARAVQAGAQAVRLESGADPDA